jgi:putative ABC transport system permease protein
VNLTRTTAIAVTALGRAKVRSLLTVLGVVIGVAAVIAMVAIGEGAKARVAQQFQAMGTSTLIVTSGASTAGGARGGAGSKPTLTWDDLTAIAALPEVAAAAPQLRAGAQVVTDLANWQTQITATTPAWFTIRSWAVTRGAALTEADVAGARRGRGPWGQTVVTNLFPDVDPIGQTVRIDRTPYTVIGVLARQGTSGFGQDNDDVVVVPSTTFVRKVGGNARYVNGQVMVMAAGRDQTAETKVAIEELLRTRHQLRADAADDFTVRDLTQVADAMKGLDRDHHLAARRGRAGSACWSVASGS